MASPPGRSTALRLLLFPFLLLSALLLLFLAPSSSAPPPPSPSNLALEWYAPFLSGGGYCSEALSFLQSTALAGLPLRAVQHGDGVSHSFVDGLPGPLRTALNQAVNRRPDHRRPTVSVCHSEPGAWHPPRWPTARCPPTHAAYTIGRTMFETDRIPKGWDERLNAMDEVWVPTDFHRDVFARGGVVPEKLVVVPEPVDVDFFDPAKVGTLMFPRSEGAGAALEETELEGAALEETELSGRREGQRRRQFRLLSVFKWEDRKGWDVLLRAYFLEFAGTPESEVVLYLLTNPYHEGVDFEARVREYAVEVLGKDRADRKGEVPAVRVIPRDRPQHALPSLYASMDALVQPSRGEGWGRPHAEAMSMGLPVIATNWSGNT